MSQLLRRAIRPELIGPFSDLAATVPEYYRKHSANPRSAVASLRRLSRLEISGAQQKELRIALSQAMAQQETLDPLLEGFLQLRAGVAATKRAELFIPAGVLRSFAYTREFLAKHSAHYGSSAERQLVTDSTDFLLQNARPEIIESYSWMLRTAHAFGQPLTELRAALQRIASTKPTLEELRIVSCAGWAQLAMRQPFSNFCEGAVCLLSALEDCRKQRRSADYAAFMEALKEIFQVPMKEPCETGAMLAGVGTLIEEEVRPWLVKAFLRTSYLQARGKDRSVISLTTHLCLRLSDYDPPQAHLDAFMSATTPGDEWITADSVLSRLQRLGAHAAALQLVETEGRRQRSAMVRDLARLSARYGEEPVQALVPAEEEVSRRALFHFARLADWHHGFGSLAFLARRPPSGEPSLLARFCAAVGDCHYVNAQDINAFPGRGVVLSNFRLERVFAAEPDGQGRPTFRTYRKNWPGLASEFEDLPQAHFVFTRGMIAVIPPDIKKYQLDLFSGREGPGVQYALAIFNDHFENHDSTVAYLLPAKILVEHLKGCVVPYADFTGFSQRHYDANKRGLTIEALRKAAGDTLLEVGSASTLLRGLENLGVPSQRIEYERLNSEFEALIKEHADRGEAWSSSHHISMVYMSPQEADEARALHERLRALRSVMGQAYQTREKFDAQITEVLNANLNLLDLVRLSEALWSKGQTVQRIMGERGMTQERPGIAPHVVPAKSSLTFDAEDAAFNPEATRVVAEAYDWYSQHQKGIKDPNQYPIFASAPTLRSSVQPDNRVLLDTFNLQLAVRGQTIQLPTSSDGNGIEECLIWINHVLPIVGSSLDTIRPYHRASLGHLTEEKRL